MRRVIFTGGRKYNKQQPVLDVLMTLASDCIIVTGGAPGLDTIANECAKELGFETEVYPAKWEKYGRSAGPIRNQYMAGLPDVELVVAFPGGVGTSGMVTIADAVGIPVLEVDDSDYENPHQF